MASTAKTSETLSPLLLSESDLENAEKTVWTIKLPKRTIHIDAYLVRTASGVRVLLVDPNRLLAEVCCFKPTTNVAVKVSEVLVRCPQLEKVRNMAFFNCHRVCHRVP
jgi:hypothetical protein